MMINSTIKYNGIGDIEKKSFGEVFTPFWLIEEMLDTLPVEVWTNPNLKWGDFCNGVGNFMIIVIKRLMIGLKEWENDDDLRYKHIVENMIYVCELQEKNMFLWMVSIDPRSEFKLNLFRGNTLGTEFDEYMKNEWKVLKFNVLLGNPPYQEQKEGNKKTQPMWHFFVEKYLNILEDNGYMTMVHPSGWRNIDGQFKNIQNKLKNLEMLYLEVHDANDGLKTFNAATRYDFYTLRNRTSNGFLTNIKCENGLIEKIDISTLEYIPNGQLNDIQILVANKDEDNVNLTNSHSAYEHRRKWMNKTKTEEYIYPCIQNVNTKNNISCFWYSNTNKNGHFGISKVIFGRKVCGVYLDLDGHYGCCEDSSFIVDTIENLHKIKQALENEKFIKLMKMCDFSGSRDKYNRKIIATFRKDFWKEFI